MLLPISRIREGAADDDIGYIDENGNEIVVPSYRFGTHFSEGVAATRTERGQTVFIALNGGVTISGNFDGVGYFREGLCSIAPKDELQVGFIDKSGNWEIDPQFMISGSFSGGLAAASLDGAKFGFVWRDGSFAVSPVYDEVRSFREGLAAVSDGQKWEFIDSSGRVAVPGEFTGPRAGPFNEGMASVQVDDSWGLLRRDGRWAVRPQFMEIGKYSEGLVAGSLPQGWGYFDPTGKRAISEWFEGCGDFRGGLAAVKRDGKWGLIDSKGEFLVGPSFDNISRCSPSMFLVTSGYTYSYMNQDGSVFWTSEEYAMPQFPSFEE